MVDDIITRLNGWVWGSNLGREPRFKASLIWVLRLGLALKQDMASGQLTMRAMSLVYTTLMSLIPLLAFSFALLKALGLHNVIQPLLSRFLRPLGPQSSELSQQLVGFVQKMNVGVLGVAGLVFLLYMVTFLVRKLEGDLNFVWQVKQQRNLRSRVSDYMTLLLVVPIMLFVTVSITAATSAAGGQSLFGIIPLGSAIYFLGKLLPYILICAGFVFLYLFVPNTRVRLLPALQGGVLAGIGWQTASWIFTSFVVGSGRYNAIYSGFAIVILSLIWLYTSWLILLIGGRIAFYLQHPESLTRHGASPKASARLEWELSLLVEILVCRRFRHGTPPWYPHTLAQQLHLPMELLESILDTLINRGLLVEGSKGEILPGRDPAMLPIPALMRELTRNEFDFHPDSTLDSEADITRRITAELGVAVEDAMGRISVADLLEELDEKGKTESTRNP